MTQYFIPEESNCSNPPPDVRYSAVFWPIRSLSTAAFQTKTRHWKTQSSPSHVKGINAAEVGGDFRLVRHRGGHDQVDTTGGHDQVISHDSTRFWPAALTHISSETLAGLTHSHSRRCVSVAVTTCQCCISDSDPSPRRPSTMHP